MKFERFTCDGCCREMSARYKHEFKKGNLCNKCYQDELASAQNDIKELSFSLKWKNAKTHWPIVATDILFTMLNNELMWFGTTKDDAVLISMVNHNSFKYLENTNVDYWICIDEIPKPKV